MTASSYGIQPLSFDEIDWVDGAGMSVSDALGYASYGAGVVGAAAGVGAAIPGPHSLAFGAVAMGFGLASVSLGAASYITKKK